MVANVQDHGKWIQLGSRDTPNNAFYEPARPLLAYVGSGIIAICFAVNDLMLLEDAMTRWHPGVMPFSPRAPILLLGCNADLRGVQDGDRYVASNGPNGETVTMEQSRSVADAIGAVQYLECSALLDGDRDQREC